jgi:hypothetical protein
LDAAKIFFPKRAPRHSVNLNAWIQQTGSSAIQECRVIDVSRTGVRLEVENTHNIPDNFLLSFSKSDPGHRASVVWRRGTEVGAEFSSANPPQPACEATDQGGGKRWAVIIGLALIVLFFPASPKDLC